MTSRGVPRAHILQNYIQERDSLLDALALARNMAIVASAALAASVLTRERGHSWLLLVAIVLGALALTALLEALSRAVVARSPERWGLRLSPFMGAFKFLFGVSRASSTSRCGPCRASRSRPKRKRCSA